VRGGSVSKSVRGGGKIILSQHTRREQEYDGEGGQRLLVGPHAADSLKSEKNQEVLTSQEEFEGYEV
jgi:hypothetical protein